MEDNQIILRPMLTEKTSLARSSGNKYYFEVHKKANKIMVKQALENLFEVKVEKCNVSNIKGKSKRNRFGTRYGKNWKKALVTLKEGDSFEFFEGI